MWWMSLASSLVAGVFTWVLANQYWQRRRPYQLAWTIGLAMFVVAAFGEFYGGAFGWTEGVYKLYYFSGVALPGFLGLGTVYLMARERPLWAHVYAAMTVIVALLFFGAVLRSDINGAALAASGLAPVHENILPLSARRPYSVLLSAVGGTVLFGGALYSWLRHGLQYNRFIAAGGLVFVVSGALSSRFGVVEVHALANLLGISLIFAGVMAAARMPRPAAAVAKAP